MTSLDDIQFDEFQELSPDQEVLIKELNPYVVGSPRSTWGPIIVAILSMITIIFLNSEWLSQKLENVSYYKYALMGILFSVLLFLNLFLI